MSTRSGWDHFDEFRETMQEAADGLRSFCAKAFQIYSSADDHSTLGPVGHSSEQGWAFSICHCSSLTKSRKKTFRIMIEDSILLRSIKKTHFCCSYNTYSFTWNFKNYESFWKLCERASNVVQSGFCSLIRLDAVVKRVKKTRKAVSQNYWKTADFWKKEVSLIQHYSQIV